MANLEGAKYAITFSSGLAAVAGIVQMLKSGDHILCASNVYSGTTEIFDELKNIKIDVETVDFENLENVRKAMKPNTRV